MTFKSIAKKLAILLKGRTIHFDHKSYDDGNDIPHIFVNGERYDIDSVKISKNGEYIECYGDYKGTGVDYTFGISVATLTETEMVGMDIYNFFQDIYYETEESGEIGDFEDDFLADK